MNRKKTKIQIPGLPPLLRSSAPRFIQEWFYGPYQSLTSEQICLSDPEWLGEAMSQEIISGQFYSESHLLKLANINPQFSISLEAKQVISERNAESVVRSALDKEERERIIGMMAQRELLYNAMSKETIAAHMEETYQFVGPWFNSFNCKLETGKYEGYTPVEILEKHPEYVMRAFSKAIVDHYHYPSDHLLKRIKQYCPDFKLSDEATIIYEYEKYAHDEEVARQEYLYDLACEEHLSEMTGEPYEGSSEDYNDNLDLDQQHPDFYQG